MQSNAQLPRTFERVQLHLSVVRGPAVLKSTALILYDQAFANPAPPPAPIREAPRSPCRARLALVTRSMTACEEAGLAAPMCLDGVPDGLARIELADGSCIEASRRALAGHSEVLRRMLDAASQWREGAQGVLALNAHAAPAVRCVVEWMAAARGAPKQAAAARALAAEQVVEAARLCHFLQADPLLAAALRTIEGAVDVSNAPSCLLLARELGAAALEEAALRVMLCSLEEVEAQAEEFWEELPQLTRETLRALRCAAVRHPLGASAVGAQPVEPREMLACTGESLCAQLERLEEARARQALQPSPPTPLYDPDAPDAGEAAEAEYGAGQRRAIEAIEAQARRVRALEAYLRTQESVFVQLLEAKPPPAGCGAASKGTPWERYASTDALGLDAGYELYLQRYAQQFRIEKEKAPQLQWQPELAWRQLEPDRKSQWAAKARKDAAQKAGVGAAGGGAPRGGGLVPSYEWQELPADEGLRVEAGLELDLPLDGRPRRARIPPQWRLCVWLEEAAGFWREDVTRHTTAGELRRAAAAFLGAPADAVQLRLGGGALADAATAEEVGLFGRTRELGVEVCHRGGDQRRQRVG